MIGFVVSMLALLTLGSSILMIIKMLEKNDNKQN